MNINLNSRMQKAVLIAALVLLLYCCYAVVRMWQADWQLAHPRALQNHQPQQAAPALTATTLAKAHVFGQDLTDNGGEMPISNLDLRLTGIVQNYDGQRLLSAKAYISMQGGPEKIYKLGDEIAPHTTIHAINSDAVIFDNQGRLEKIMLTRPELVFKPRNKME